MRNDPVPTKEVHFLHVVWRVGFLPRQMKNVRRKKSFNILVCHTSTGRDRWTEVRPKTALSNWGWGGEVQHLVILIRIISCRTHTIIFDLGSIFFLLKKHNVCLLMTKCWSSSDMFPVCTVVVSSVGRVAFYFVYLCHLAECLRTQPEMVRDRRVLPV